MKKLLPFILLIAGVLLTTCEERERANPFDTNTELSPDSWAPTNLQVQVLNDAEIKLNWTQEEMNISGFRIGRKTGIGSFTQIAQVGKDLTEYTDTGLIYGTSYVYRVSAFTDANESGYVASDTTTMIIQLPTNLAATVVDDQSIQLTWTDNCVFEDGYRLERSENSASFTHIAELGENIIEYVDTVLNLGANYIYRLAAFTDENVSDYAEITINFRQDCNGDWDGNAFENDCGCVGGNTGLVGDYCYGCTDSYATNYDPDVIVDDGSCIYVWNQTFGGSSSDYGYSVQQTTDGGYIVTGTTSSYGNGSNDAWLIKTDSLGQEEWNQSYGGSGNDYASSVQQTTDGGYIITGCISSDDVWLIKMDSQGQEEWNNSFDGEYEVEYYGSYGYDGGNSIEETNDGGYIVVGKQFTRSYLAYIDAVSMHDIWLIKTEANGSKEWDMTFGDSGDNYGTSVQQTSDDGYIIVGVKGIITGYDYYGYPGYNRDIWLIKTDSNGNEEWNRTFGGSSNDYGYSVQQTTDGGYIITGSTASYGNGGYDVWLIKTNAQGNEEWSHTFGGSSNDYGYSVQQTTDGGYIITGWNGSPDVWLIKTDSQGNDEWNQTFGGSGNDRGESVQQTSDGGYIITGSTASYGNGGYDVWLIKTDSEGNTAPY